jgi:hypothetical protein
LIAYSRRKGQTFGVNCTFDLFDAPPLLEWLPVVADHDLTLINSTSAATPSRPYFSRCTNELIPS